MLLISNGAGIPPPEICLRPGTGRLDTIAVSFRPYVGVLLTAPLIQGYATKHGRMTGGMLLVRHFQTCPGSLTFQNRGFKTLRFSRDSVTSVLPDFEIQVHCWF